jgi:hypothetical protein
MGVFKQTPNPRYEAPCKGFEAGGGAAQMEEWNLHSTYTAGIND